MEANISHEDYSIRFKNDAAATEEEIEKKHGFHAIFTYRSTQYYESKVLHKTEVIQIQSK